MLHCFCSRAERPVGPMLRVAQGDPAPGAGGGADGGGADGAGADGAGPAEGDEPGRGRAARRAAGRLGHLFAPGCGAGLQLVQTRQPR